MNKHFDSLFSFVTLNFLLYYNFSADGAINCHFYFKAFKELYLLENKGITIDSLWAFGNKSHTSKPELSNLSNLNWYVCVLVFCLL